MRRIACRCRSEKKKKNCNWWLFKSAPKRNALAADNSISNWISRARSLARRSYSCSESTCCRMQAKPGAPPRGYCYRAGSKHAAHGKVTIRGSEAFGRTGGWMEKRCNVTLKSFIGRFFFFLDFFRPTSCVYIVNVFVFVDRRKTHARRNRTQAVSSAG